MHLDEVRASRLAEVCSLKRGQGTSLKCGWDFIHVPSWYLRTVCPTDAQICFNTYIFVHETWIDYQLTIGLYTINWCIRRLELLRCVATSS